MYNNDFQTFLKISTETCPAARILHGDLQIKTTGNVYNSVQKQIQHTQLKQLLCNKTNHEGLRGVKTVISSHWE